MTFITGWGRAPDETELILHVRHPRHLEGLWRAHHPRRRLLHATRRGKSGAGANGAGKSTLLAIIAGTVEPDAGTVALGAATRIGHFPQHLRAEGTRTIEAFLREASGVSAAEAALDEVTAAVAAGRAELGALADAQSGFEEVGGYFFESRVQAVLEGLGAGDLSLEQPISTLSGGQKSTIALAGVLLRGLDLLLLDEPTNNLDLPALLWLEQFLATMPAACLIVSHDRQLLDRTTTKTLALDASTHALAEFPGTFGAYEACRAKQRERQLQMFREQQREIARLEHRLGDLKASSVRRSAGVGRIRDNDKATRNFKNERSGSKTARRARQIETRLERMPRLAKPFERKPISLTFGSAADERPLAVIVREASLARGTFCLHPVSLDVEAGSRVVLLGAIGSGKSTFLQLLTGALPPTSGSVDVRGTVGWYDQEHSRLAENLSGIEAFMELTGMERSFSFRYLKSLGIEQDELTKQISAFSPGGRARILLAVLMAQQPEVLLLDEPTNHLDVEELAALEEALALYTGTLVLVTHDRRFLERVQPTHLLTIGGGDLSPVESISAYETRVVRSRGALRVPRSIA